MTTSRNHSTPDRDVDALQRVLPPLVEQILRAHGAFDGAVTTAGTEIELTWPTGDPRKADLVYRFSGVREDGAPLRGYSTLTIPLRGGC